MKRILCCVLLACAMMLTACSHEPEPLSTKRMEFALTDNNVLLLDIPEDWELTERDGYHYWKFNENTTVYKEHSPVSTGDKKGECYYSTYAVSRNFDGYTITISTDKKMVDSVGDLLNKAQVIQRDVSQYRERELEYMPEFQDYAMDFTTNGLYMPLEYKEVEADIYTACTSINGTNFVTCWIMNYKIDDLKPLLNNLVTSNANDTTLTKWYESNDIYYAECGDCVVGAKKLTYNQWCCYLSSRDGYDDYLRKALLSIKAAN